jgi:arginine decarboxylase
MSTKPTENIIAKNFFTIAQLRYERWNSLKSLASRVSYLEEEGENISNAQKEILKILKDLKSIESYYAYPGRKNIQFLEDKVNLRSFEYLNEKVAEIVKMLVSETYRFQPQFLNLESDTDSDETDTYEREIKHHYFETLFVDNFSDQEERELHQKVKDLRGPEDEFVYDIVTVNSFQDALIAVLFNYNIQVVAIRYDFKFNSSQNLKLLLPFISQVLKFNPDYSSNTDHALILGKAIKKIRPEVDIYYVTNQYLTEIESSALDVFRRIFYRKEDLQELHLSITRGIAERFETPFFSALKKYSQKPTSVFHAMPISRGNSVFKSFWIRDLGEFYGRNLFLAETSATTGGLDSLLQPTGPLKKAQELAAKAFGSERTFFATNGTSTANKIVVQALVKPGDIVLVDRDCHKSHHYGLVLSGAFPVYLDSYPLPNLSMYGAVPLNEIKHNLLALKKANRLDKAKMVLLTNCTFDGIVYNVEKVMEEVLAIKPDMIFLWDEAWFAFAAFTTIYRKRTAMYVAKKLLKKYQTEEYKNEYQAHLKSLKEGEQPKLPDPSKVRIRVYSTQSTHKTLSSLRQGSMVHIHDQDFRKKAESSFWEAYMTHTSTSANYQILASLDIGRRQAVFEGFEMVEKSVEMAMVLRAKINDNPQLRKYFDVTTIEDLIPTKFRRSGLNEYYDTKKGWNRFEEAWEKDEFVLDPTKINLYIGRTGVDGDTFKNKYLMDEFNIQINKTSRNTVLFMTNIGTTRGSVAYLISVLIKISKKLDEKIEAMNHQEFALWKKKVKQLDSLNVALPDFSRFHDTFRATPGVPGGNMRKAYFLAYNEDLLEYIPLEKCKALIKKGKELVSAKFVIPYPPGFPVLVPGQIVSKEILEFLMALDVDEIHGFSNELGLLLFKPEALI